MATITTRVQGAAPKGSPLTNVEVDDNFLNLNADKLEKSGGAMTGDLEFGDGKKAIFGTGSDLEIYHDGANSYISDNGTGNLYVRASDNMFFQSSDNVHRYAEFINGGAVKLRFDNSHKLQTTSTGIDVTGTVTADELLVSAAGGTLVNLTATDAGTPQNLIKFNDTGGTTAFVGHASSGSDHFYIQNSTAAGHIVLNTNGNVGIGTSSPQTNLQINSNGGGGIRLERIDTAVGTGDSFGSIEFSQQDASDQGAGVVSKIESVNESSFSGYGALAFSTGSATSNLERLRINSAGNVGIGTSSPTSQLSLSEETANTTTQSDQIRVQAGSSGTTGVGFGSNIYFVGERNDGNAQAMGRIGFAASTNSGSNLSSDFIVQTASSGTPAERMRIDSSGNVGIGTSNPATKLHITKDGNQSAVLDAYEAQQVSHNTIAYTRWVQNASGIANIMGVDSSAGILGTSSNHPLSIRTNNTTAMTIDSAGNVGIGVVPSAWNTDTGGRTALQIGFGSISGRLNDTQAEFTNNAYATGTGNTPQYAGITRWGKNQIAMADGGVIVFKNAPAVTEAEFALSADFSWNERMRLDSAGNLLVGTTTTNSDVAGHVMYGGALAGVSTQSAATRPLYINRLSSDGDIIELAKDGTTVGSIGTGLSSLAVGTGNTQLMFWNAQNGIFPSNGSTVTDDSIDFGNPNYRFKDIYLSGNAFLNGRAVVDSGTGFVKYADGTLICYGKTNVTTNTAFTNQFGSSSGTIHRDAFSFYYAQTFIAAPTVNASGGGVCSVIEIGGAPSTSSCPLYAYATANNQPLVISHVATGRWF